MLVHQPALMYQQGRLPRALLVHHDTYTDGLLKHIYKKTIRFLGQM